MSKLDDRRAGTKEDDGPTAGGGKFDAERENWPREPGRRRNSVRSNRGGACRTCEVDLETERTGKVADEIVALATGLSGLTQELIAGQGPRARGNDHDSARST